MLRFLSHSADTAAWLVKLHARAWGVGVGVQSALVGFWRTEIEFSAEFGGEDVCVSLQAEAFPFFTTKRSLEIFSGSLAFVTRET